MKRALWTAVLLGGGLTLAAPYTVQPGDTLWSLARAHGLTVAQVMQLNHLTTDALRAGQVLQLQLEAETPAPVPAATDDTPPPATPGQRGMAVYYPGRFSNLTALTAAHPSLPFGTWVRVQLARSGRSVDVMINDRGPFGNPERIIDLSTEAARALGMLDDGVAAVTLTVLRQP
ncbi:RlpA-like double-psi beta-barrel domain-containing protein [Deinococcus sonorensis]|uniref:RlpA-like double-psi beta-barrel domain-containing protein n=2 Tax=Deinococcus sonorensis TaxID=309891 RepID=A0AAU7U9W9_9DEIO